MMQEPSSDNVDLLIISDPHKDRYASHRLIPWWDQAKLATAQVMVVGAGALGNEVLKDLALLGVGHIFIVDFDEIEMSNLTRSVLFRAEDAGRLKAEVAAERVRSLNPDVGVRSFCGDVVRELGLGVFRRMDVVIGCLDNREARWAVNRACWRLGIPWVDGGLDALGGQVKVFVPPDGACYECGMTDLDIQVISLRTPCPGVRPEDIVQGRMPTTITGASIIAGVQVQETLKLLHGLPVIAGGAFIYDGAGTGSLTAQLSRREDCEAHKCYEPVVQLDASAHTWTLKDLLQTVRKQLGKEAFLSLDRQLLTRLDCYECDTTEVVMRPYDGRLPDDLACPKCGERRSPDLTHQVDASTPESDACLADLGIPPLHILAGRNGDRTVYFELTADASVMLDYRQGG